jgi:phenylacetate-CoA ligase
MGNQRWSLNRKDPNGEKRALELFHTVARRVPAYKNFLEKEHIQEKKIRTYADFVKYVPLIDKENYISQYPLADLCLDGNLFTNRIISVSSGSTGEPSYWPRGLAQDLEGARMHTPIYDDIFQMNRKSTLFVVCFSMGAWIAGSFTTSATLTYIDKGNPVNIITPGLDKTEAINAIKYLAPSYEQVVLVGYPPFTKDIIDEGTRAGIKWKEMKTRIMTAGEAFSEEWRDYVLKLVHSTDPYHDAINVYGSADAGMLGYETPVSILMRRIYNQRPKTRSDFFGTDMTPSIIQYDPQHRHFEAVNGELVFTAMSGIPFVRYNIKDFGGIMSFDEAVAPIEERFTTLASRYGVNVDKWRQQPFLYLKGRKGFSTTIYAVNVYPENIKAALIDRRVQRWVTGRFTMATHNYSDMDQFFEINVELAQDFVVKKQHQELVEEVILQKLTKLNAEFHKLHTAIGVKALPRVHLIKFGDPEYFSQTGKHKWIKKER